MISFQNVSFTYAESGNGGVLDLNLIVRSGECVLLCGPSGCGKTTITRLANGLIPHFFHGNLSGQVGVNGMLGVEVSYYDIGPQAYHLVAYLMFDRATPEQSAAQGSSGRC